jgi:hypothetical protein
MPRPWGRMGRPKVEDAPDRWVPPVGDRRESKVERAGGACWAGSKLGLSGKRIGGK